MMKGKCNCGKKATSEWLITSHGACWEMKFCDVCKPKREEKGMVNIYGEK
jgi:hypothetical protein